MGLHPLQIGDSLQPASAFKCPFDAKVDFIEPDGVIFDQVVVRAQLERLNSL
jgi:hypothetical protein